MAEEISDFSAADGTGHGSAKCPPVVGRTQNGAERVVLRGAGGREMEGCSVVRKTDGSGGFTGRRGGGSGAAGEVGGSGGETGGPTNGS